MIISVLLGACATTNTVLIVPPNYGIVVNLSNTASQATANDFSDGELMNVTQQTVTNAKCTATSVDWCPDKIIAEVPGSPVSRIYSKDKESGTSATNQALCFESNGANGCLDFSITAQVTKGNAKCYANKVGVKPVIEADNKPSRFHFAALPLSDALDTRVIQIASGKFARQVATTSPLELSLKKFDLFDAIKPAIIAEVLDQTCITIKDISINNGVVWDSVEIQKQIDQATVIVNQLELAAKQNQLLDVQNKAFIARAIEVEKQFGTAAAIEFMRIQKWDGSYLPALPQQYAPQNLQSTAPLTVTATP